MTNQNEIFSYDAVPYKSEAHQVTRPDHLATVARIFGLDAPDFRQSSVLELGCAGGGNLIPMAAAFPGSRFYGIDLSETQIDEGKRAVTDLGLKNITLTHRSILDVDLSDGPFDYIIAHGVYTWVPEQVRDKILSVCKENLSDTGLACIGYNTRPGWNTVKTVRDMMIYHTGPFDDPATKVREARRMVEFAASNAVASEQTYRRMLDGEAKLIENSPDFYLYHDHLEPDNAPCYFHEFMDRAARQGLQYLGDCSLPSMYVGNFAPQAREILGQMNDIVRQEQYLDFLTNRRFRNTVLCHAGHPLSRDVSPDRLEALYFSTSLIPQEGLENVDLSLERPTEFVRPPSATRFTARNRVLAASFCVLAEQGDRPLDGAELAARASQRLHDVSEDVVLGEFLENAVKLLFSGALEVFSDPGSHVNDVSDRPTVWPCARYLARTRSEVPNLLHKSHKFSDDLRALVPFVDGTRSLDRIRDAILQRFLDGELSFRLDDKLIEDAETLAPLLKEHVDAMLGFLADRAFLVA